MIAVIMHRQLRAARALLSGASTSVAAVVLCVLALVGNWNCIGGYNISADDVYYVVSVMDAAYADLPSFAALALRHGGRSYTPVLYALHRVFYELGVATPLGSQVFAVGALALVGVLVYLAGVRIIGDRRWALAAACFYVLHPMHKEGYTFLVLPHYLASGFLLAGLLAHLGGRERGPGPRRVATVCSLHLLAAFSKEPGVLLPAFLLAADALLPMGPEAGAAGDRRRRLLAEYAALAATTALYGMIRLRRLPIGIELSFSAMATSLREGFPVWSLLALAPLALPLALPGRGVPFSTAKASFCASWFLLGVALYLPLGAECPLVNRYCILGYIGVAWLLGVMLDFAARRAGRLWCLVVPFWVALAFGLDVYHHVTCFSRCFSRSVQLRWTSEGLGACSRARRDDGRCCLAALALPLIRKKDPQAYTSLVRQLNEEAGPQEARTIVEFFGEGVYEAGSPRWRRFSALYPRMSSGGAGLDDLRLFLEAERKFQEGGRLLEAGRPLEAARRYENALREWPGLYEAHLQRARALRAAGDDEGAQESYARLLADEMGVVNLQGLRRRYCRPPESCPSGPDAVGGGRALFR